MTVQAPPRSRLSIWWQAVRAFSFTASAMPVVVGAAYAWLQPVAVSWWLFPFVLVAAVLLHGGTNLFNDYYDFRKGVDRQGTKGSSGILVAGLLEPHELKRAAVLLFVVATVLGCVIISVRGWPIVVLGLVGMVAGYLYTGGPWAYKYVALGDLFVFILMGPLMVCGSYYALTGALVVEAVVLSLPVGCLVAAILCANNYRDRDDDAAAGIRTMAIVLPPSFARAEYYLLVLGAYACVALLVAVFALPWTVALVFLSLPLAAKNVKTLAADGKGAGEAGEGDGTADGEGVATLDVATAQLHFLFSLLLTVGLVVGGLMAGGSLAGGGLS